MPDVEKHIYKVLRDNFPLLCTDGVVMQNRQVLLVKRLIEPFKGFWTLPGGHVDFGETLEDAVRREVYEETGIKANVIGLIDVFSQPQRDPWGHIVSIAYLLTPIQKQENYHSKQFESDEVELIKWFQTDIFFEPLGFDHEKMIEAAKKRFPKYFEPITT